MEYKREIDIAVEPNIACDFLKHVENLPVWTRFFKRCVRSNDAIGDMETMLGPSKTHIKQEAVVSGMRLIICSEFKERTEEAVVTVTKHTEAKSIVTFFLKVPPHFTQEQQMKMVGTVEEELRFLKKHLETDDG